MTGSIKSVIGFKFNLYNIQSNIINGRVIREI